MNRKLTLLFFVLFFVRLSASQAQSCPANIDFESGLGTWIYYRGSVSAGPVYSLTATPPVPGLHTLTGGSGTDPYGGFPVVAPGGGMHSLQIGHDSANASAERAEYFIHVPATGTFTLLYKYAIVMRVVGSAAAQQSRFVVSATDSATGTAVPCATYNWLSGATSPGFLSAGGSSDVLYYPWRTGNMKFAGLGGHTIRLDVTAAGSTDGAYWCYGYFDMSCDLVPDTIITCGSHTLYLIGSDGYADYSWFDSATFTIPYGISQEVAITPPLIPTTYADIVTPYTGFGCTDTLYTRVIPSDPILHPTDDTVICSGTSVTLTSGATSTAPPLTYLWSPGTSLSCTTCASPVATPSATGVYAVTVTDSLGCAETADIHITVNPMPAAITGITSLCVDSITLLSDAVTGGVWSSSNPAIAIVGSASGIVIGIAPDTATITYSTGASCTTSTVVTVNPASYCSTEVGSVNNNAFIKVFPNPNDGGFTLSLSSPVDEPATGTITNMIGEKVDEFTISTNKTISLNLSCPPGIYVLSVITPHGKLIEQLSVIR